MNKALIAILMTIALDSMGIGLIMPILPALIRDAGHLGETSWQFGALLSLYAAMQFLFAPLLGSLSDRYGRRPVLLASLAGAAADYLFMAFAPNLWMLFLGRAISGITGANMTVGMAYITDITPEDQRAKRFGQMGALFGIGFMVGPIIGGLLGAYWVRAPFLAAAALNGISLLWTLFFMPESRKGQILPGYAPKFNLLGPLKPLMEFRSFWPLIGVMLMFAIIGEVAPTIWVLYGEDKFAWNTTMLGLSISCFGLFHAAAQGVIVGPLQKMLGDKGSLLFAMAADASGYLGMAFASKGWMAFPLMPLFALGGAANPVLSAMLSAKVDSDNQGKLMGALTSLNSFASIFCPLAISTLYLASRHVFPGTVWVLGVAGYVLCVPILLRLKTDKAA